MTIMDGKAVAQNWKQDMRRMLLMCKTPPCLAVISVGEDPASQVYIRNKKKACEEMGLRFEDCHFPANVTLKELATTIRRLNKDKTVNGIILQLPLSDHLREYEDHLLEWIVPSKDVDGLTSLNQGRLIKDGYGLGFTPCTPFGICNGMVTLLHRRLSVLTITGNCSAILIRSAINDCFLSRGQ